VSTWGVSPRASVTAECSVRGRPAVVRGCLDLLTGRDLDASLVRILAGPAADWVLDAGPDQAYWLRVWAARGLLWVWEDEAADAIGAALEDEAWRVREMAAKVVARHRVDEALEAVRRCQADPVPRVRAAADRAVVALVSRSN
jgi:HEAT repeat protein